MRLMNMASPSIVTFFSTCVTAKSRCASPCAFVTFVLVCALIFLAGATTYPANAAGAASPSSFVPGNLVATPLIVKGPAVASLTAPLPEKAPSIYATPPYSPYQLWNAYGINSLPSFYNGGEGVTVAVVEPYGDVVANERVVSANKPQVNDDLDYAEYDLQAFSNYYGLPFSGPMSVSPTLTEVFTAGSPGPTNPIFATETALDIETIHSIAPKAHILLVISPDFAGDIFDSVEYAAEHAPIVSISWGFAEMSSQTEVDSALFNRPRVAFFAAAGALGAEAGVLYPSTSPYVTAVGGTSLSLYRNGARYSETAWSGSGGGASAYESLPAFQDEWLTSSNREVPDVSADADPNTGVDVYQAGAWLPYLYGGTALSTAIWAGITAVAEGGSSINVADGPLLNASLYYFGSPATLDTYFNDITTGSNGFLAVPGYDEATGLGTPIVNTLVPALVAPRGITFAPTGGPVGTEVTVTGVNLYWPKAVSFNGTPATGFTAPTNSSLIVTVPAFATTGPMTVTTINGSTISAGNFVVTGPYKTATTTTLSSTPNPSALSQQVVFTATVTGSGGSPTGTVTFDDTTTGATLATVILNTGTAKLNTAALAAGSHAVVAVYNGNTTFAPSKSAAVTQSVAPPTINGISPTTGPVGTKVIISGSNLTGASSVWFNGVAATAFTVNSSIQLTATAPAGATTGAISVSTSSGTATSSQTFTVK